MRGWFSQSSVEINPGKPFSFQISFDIIKKMNHQIEEPEEGLIMAEKRNTYKIQELDGSGEVYIADEVVAIIAGLAATEVEGVASMAGNITNELVGKLGMKNLSKGVKVNVLENVVTVDLALNIAYGKNILETSKTVQEKVKAAIENMTGLEVADVNIRIASVDMENEKGK